MKDPASLSSKRRNMLAGVSVSRHLALGRGPSAEQKRAVPETPCTAGSIALPQRQALFRNAEGIHVARGIGIDDETANRAVTSPMKAYGMIDDRRKERA
jgi:hypothetical protein